MLVRSDACRVGFKATVVLLPLLGITWFFAFLSTGHEATLVFTYLFTICNSMQVSLTGINLLIIALHVCYCNTLIRFITDVRVVTGRKQKTDRALLLALLKCYVSTSYLHLKFRFRHVWKLRNSHALSVYNSPSWICDSLWITKCKQSLVPMSCQS